MPEISGRYVKVDLELRELRAIQELCEMASALLRDVGGVVGKTQREDVQTALNSVRFKMGCAEELIAPGSTASATTLQLLDKQRIHRLR